MRLSMASISLLVLFSALPAQSAAVFFTINFTNTMGMTFGGGPVPTPTGSGYYDPTLPPTADEMYAFSASSAPWTYGFGVFGVFGTIIHNGEVFGSPICAGGQTGDAAIFEILTNCSGTWYSTLENDITNQFNMNYADAGGSMHLFGSFFPLAVPNADTVPIAGGNWGVPEPSTTALLLIGLGWLMRKRKLNGLR